MSKTNRRRFGPDTWVQGTRALIEPHATSKPLIENMRVWSDGLLGPRPLWTDPVINITDANENIATLIRPAEFVYLDEYYEGYLSVSPSYVRFYNRSGTLLAEASATTQTGRHMTATRITDTHWLVGKMWINLRRDSVSVGTWPIVTVDANAALKTAFSLFTHTVKGSTVHQGRAFYWGYGSDAVAVPYPSNRVYYSDSVVASGYSAYHTFSSATQFFDVDGEVLGCVSVGSNLMIWTREGRWFVMQGSGDPATATFSYLGTGKIPNADRWPLIWDRTVYFVSSDETSLVSINAGGIVEDRELAYLGFRKTPAAFYSGSKGTPNDDSPVVPALSSLYNSALFPYLNTSARHNRSGVWTEETWDWTDLDIDADNEYQVAIDERNGREMLAVWDSGSDWNIHEREIMNDEPSPSPAGDWSEYSEDYVDVPGRVVLPRIFEPDKQVRIKKVIIDAVTWESTGTFHPAATMTVKVNDGKATTTPLTLGPASDPLSSVPDTDRKPIRIVATGAPTSYTSFSDVSLEDIEGIAIETVMVEYEIVGTGLVK